jgi:NAD(P)-dependent dehydrogenase (short-subunit alcohol dehydrogenase family)
MEESRVWQVRGSSRGLGRSMAVAAAAAGERVMATARRTTDLDDLIAAYSDRVGAFPLDVTDQQAARAAVATVGRINQFPEQSQGTQQGDPDRAGAVIVNIVAHDDPPRRLLLGSDALASALAAGAARNAEAEKWAEVSRSTDHPQ